MSKIQFFALGGQDEVGKNCFILEVDNDIYIINAGIKFPINNSYGIDNIIPDFQYLLDNEKRIKGLFLTDTKNQSFSALPWLLMKFKKMKIYTAPVNKYVILERISKYKISANDFEIIPLTNEITKIGNIEVQAIAIASSMPFSLAYNFKTKDGDFLFLINLILGNSGHNNIYGDTNLEKIKESISPKGLISLFLDSGTSNYPGHAKDKINLTPMLEKVFNETQNNQRIIVGAYDEEMAAINQVLDLAKKYNRPVVMYGRSYNFLFSLLFKIYPDANFPEVLDYKDLLNPKLVEKTSKAVVLVTSTRERLHKRFIRITENNDVFLKLSKTDHVIFMAPPVNGLEVYASFTLDEVARITRNITNIEIGDYYFYRPAKEDVYDIIKFLKPKYFIPIQGLYRYLVNATFEAVRAGMNNNNCVVLQNGKIAEFKNGELISRNTKIHHVGDTMIDGFGVGDISIEVIREREILAKDGVISVSTILNQKNNGYKIVSDIVIDYVGVVAKSQKNDVDLIINSIVQSAFEESDEIDLSELQQSLRKQIRKKIMKKIQKEPLVVITFFVVN